MQFSVEQEMSQCATSLAIDLSSDIKQKGLFFFK